MSDSSAANRSHTMPALASGTAAARPKIMRRPALFAANLPAALVPDVPIIPEKISATATPSRPWQDDAKFAVTLLAFVIVVNLVVIVWLNAIQPKPVAALHTMPVIVEPSTGPAPESSPIHVLEDSADQ